MSFREWVRDHTGEVAAVDGCRTKQFAQCARGLILGIREVRGLGGDELLIEGYGCRLRISHIARVRTPVDIVTCSAFDTFQYNYDDPWDPEADHKGLACPIHDEAQWRLSTYQRKGQAKPGALVVDLDLTGEVGICGCTQVATVRVEFYSPSGVFLRSALRCDACAGRKDPRPPNRAKRFRFFQQSCAQCSRWLPTMPTTYSVRGGDGSRLATYIYQWTCRQCGHVRTFPSRQGPEFVTVNPDSEPCRPGTRAPSKTADA